MPSGTIQNPRVTKRPPQLPQRQRGAALIMAAGVIVAMVTMMALAIDLGQVYATKENLDTAANMAALEAARAVAGCNASGLPADPDAAALAAATAAVNRAYSGRSGAVPSVATALGGKQISNNLRSFTPNASLPEPVGTAQPVTNSAVQVTLSDSGYTSITGAFFKPTLSARATAEAIPKATFRVGSSLLRLQPEFLEPLGIDVGVFDQGDLTDASVDLGDLAVELGVGTIDDLLDLDVETGNLLEAINDVSGQSLGDLSTALSTDLSQTEVSLGSVIANLGDVGQTAQVNSEALADALLQLALADREDGIPIPLDINVANLASVVANVRILEPPQLAVDVRPGLETSVASNSQILVEIVLSISAPNLVSGVANVEAEIPLYIRAGHASATLENIYCATASTLRHTIEIDAVAETGSLGLGGFDDISASDPQPTRGGSIEVSVLQLLGGLLGGSSLVSATATIAPTQVPIGSTSASPLMPLYSEPPVDDNIREISAGLSSDVADQLIGEAADLGDVDSQLTLSILGLSLSTGLNVESALSGIVASTLGSPVITSLLDGLGIKLGSAEVTLIGAQVDQPVIFESS